MNAAKKEQFLTLMRLTVKETYRDGWARDTDKLNRFMSAVEQTITKGNKTWTPDGAAYTIVCKKLGFDNAVPLKGLLIWLNKA